MDSSQTSGEGIFPPAINNKPMKMSASPPSIMRKFFFPNMRLEATTVLLAEEVSSLNLAFVGAGPEFVVICVLGLLIICRKILIWQK